MEVDAVSSSPEKGTVDLSASGSIQAQASVLLADAQSPEADQNSEPKLRNNAIHLYGVDDLGTSDIETFMLEYYNKPFQIEWIDDSSLNIVYEDPEDAFQALVNLTAPAEFEAPDPITPGQLRRLKVHPVHPEVDLRARFAFDRDQKTSGARAKSRFYLLHGEPTRKEDLARFGTKRSKPMTYGFKNRDILSKRRREDQIGDLFPDKAPTLSMDTLGDLFPEKVPNKSKRRRNRKRNKDKMPDLFANKLGDSDSHENKNATTSVYQNMDY